MIVYTAIFDAYDTVPPAPFADDCPHILFTDELPDDPRGWDVRLAERQHASPQRENRMYKLQPHTYFPGETTIYHDGNIHLHAPVIHELGDADIVMPLHPRRRTAMQELQAVRGYGLVAATTLDKLEARYESVDLTVPIPEANIIIATPRAEPFMTAWWAEVRDYSPRDQLAYAFALQTAPVTVRLSTTLQSHAQRVNHLKPRPRGVR